MYNILFYFNSPFVPQNGGVERVSDVLGNWLIDKGCHIYYLSDVIEGANSIFIENGKGFNSEVNKEAFQQFIKEKSIDVIVNQAGIFRCSKGLLEIERGKCSLISVFHNSLMASYSYPSISNNIVVRKILSTSLLRLFFVCLFFFKNYSFYRLVRKKSDRIVVLSKEYFKEVDFFCGKSNKTVAIGNPLTLPMYKEKIYNKQNELLFLGRLTWQKRPDLLLDIWERIGPKHPNWKLRFVGSGDMYDLLYRTVINKSLNNVYFEGSCSPEHYLKSGKILCMTSVFEGFPLVLFEAMNYGNVPIVFDSFASVKDIITNHKDGYIVPSFDIDEYSACLEKLMMDDVQWSIMSSAAIKKAHCNTIDVIGEKWLSLFSELKNNK